MICWFFVCVALASSFFYRYSPTQLVEQQCSFLLSILGFSPSAQQILSIQILLAGLIKLLPSQAQVGSISYSFG